MEFYNYDRRRGSWIKVSIPNGMEFYAFQTAGIWPRKSFNSQRDGILLTYAWYSAVSWSRFNSQRDGILLYAAKREAKAVEGFNSQRDGILLKMIVVSVSLSFVSIPNGMEFYPGCVKYVIGGKRFNSQRDGILRRRQEASQ